MDVSLIFAPFIGSLIAFISRPVLHNSRGPLMATLAICYSAVVSIILFFDTTLGQGRDIPVFEWVTSGNFHVLWSLRVDPPSALMLFVITLVSAAVHIYSLDYMRDDPRRDVFFGNISLFTGFMILLVTSDDLLQLYFGWEGVGLSSYLLINHWYERESANNAAIKSFIVNRVGDFAFFFGLLGVFVVFGSLDFDVIFAKVPQVAGQPMNFLGFQVDALTTICLLLFVGAMGKSAQLGLHVWLPDAMEAPTPVSALIHAATMVTAGVFMLVRLSPLFQAAPLALDVVAVVGALTAFMAATIALTQFDIKRIIAYSTMSQLGFMFVACGVSAYDAAMFHLFTHAFFKALLFLGAGVVIHALSGEQDIRKMGGLAKLLPVTAIAMAIGSLALAGMPGFAGYYSKEAIMTAVFDSGRPAALFAFGVLLVTIPLTAFYSWRLMFAVFFGAAHQAGQEHGDTHGPGHHGSAVLMVLTVVALAVGAIASGLVGDKLLIGAEETLYWAKTIALVPDPAALPLTVQGLITGLAGLGILAAWAAYIRWPALPGAVARRLAPLDAFFRAKWGFDTFYHKYLVLASLSAGRRLSSTVDGSWIDGLLVRRTVNLTDRITRACSRLQTGKVYDYALTMVAGITIIIWLSISTL